MAKYVFIGAILVGAAVLISNNGCGAVQDRVGVVADKALKEIDKMIGDLDVQRKKVERQYKEVQKATLQVSENHVRYKVQLKHALAKQEQLANEKNNIKAKLKTLKELLEKADETGSTTFNGREVTKDSLNQRATTLLKKLKPVNSMSKTADQTVISLQKTVDKLAVQKKISDQQITKLTGMIETIDGQIDTLKARRVAESIVSPGKDINTVTEDLAASVQKLSEELEVQIAISDEKLDARVAELDSSLSAESDDLFFENKDDVSSTLSDIDKALMEE